VDVVAKGIRTHCASISTTESVATDIIDIDRLPPDAKHYDKFRDALVSGSVLQPNGYSIHLYPERPSTRTVNEYPSSGKEIMRSGFDQANPPIKKLFHYM